MAGEGLSGRWLLLILGVGCEKVGVVLACAGLTESVASSGRLVGKLLVIVFA